MLTKIFNILSVFFGGIVLGVILACLECSAFLDKDGYDVGIKNPKVTE